MSQSYCQEQARGTSTHPGAEQKYRIAYSVCVHVCMCGLLEWDVINKTGLRKNSNDKCNGPLNNAIKIKSFKDSHLFGMVGGGKNERNFK